MRATLFFIVIMLICNHPIRADACEALVDKRDNHIKIAKDGSFQNANIVDVDGLGITYANGGQIYLDVTGTFDAAAGLAIEDRGNGRVVQLLVFSDYACFGREALLFTDCEDAKSLLIFGKPSPEELRGEGVAGFDWSAVKNIQPPYGPIRITDSSTVDDLAKTAKRHDIQYMNNPESVFAGVRKRDAYDIRLGCKLFYPDSLSAKS